MITEQQVLAVFSKFLPPDVKIVVVDHDEYIREARHHPFIAMQIDEGIYDATTFSDEFLSVARSFSAERTIEVDMHLILSHMDGVDPLLAAAYCANIALHEYHHITHHPDWAETAQEQWQRETECEKYLSTNHRDTVVLANEAERRSKTIQTVYSRLGTLTGTRP